MPRYIYTAKSNPKQTIQGDIEAESEQDAINKLTRKGKQWATENPLTTPSYSQKYGLPAQNTGKPDWVVTGHVQGEYGTQPAPGSYNNPANTGGAAEVIPRNPDDVVLDSFYMPED